MAHQLYMQGMSYNREDAWQEQANCKNKAFELFEYQEKDSPLAKDMNFQERQEFNVANFELAAEICIECPVFLQCKESASADDKYWTVRAGEMPGRFNSELPPEDPGRYCQRGHWLQAGGRCQFCKREAMKKRRANAKLDS